MRTSTNKKMVTLFGLYINYAINKTLNPISYNPHTLGT